MLRGNHKKRNGSRRCAVQTETCENRALLSSITVTSLADNLDVDGQVTLREAIQAANTDLAVDGSTAGSGADVITFRDGLTGTVNLEFFFGGLGEMEISGALTITGNGSTNTIIDAQRFSRIFDITDTAGDVTLDSLTLRNGRTTGNNQNGADNTFSGGVIRSLSSGTLTVTRSMISGNSTTGGDARGGAIYAQSGAVTVSQSTLSGNSTAGHNAFGGAIASPTVGNVTITNSTLSGNQVLGTGAYGGGALYFDDGDVTITNSTITGNSANVGGGIGIFADDAGESLTIRNSIIAGNTAATNPDFTAPANPGTNLSVQNSLIGNNTGTALTEDQDGDANGNFIGGSAANVINPQLGPLQNNGGPTFTHALLTGSLAINSGSNALAAGLTTDQRGAPIARIFNTTVDMGAYELFTIVVPIVVSTTTDDVDSDISTGDLSLREAILLANGSSGANTITFAASTNGTEFDLSLGQMAISETVTITGNGAANTVIDAQLLSRIFGITETAGNVTLAQLTLTKGKPTLNEVPDLGRGGAVRSLSSGTLTVSQSTLSGNSTAGDFASGGAIYSASGAVTVTQSTLSGNSTAGSYARGGAIYAGSGAVTVSQSTLSGNSTTGGAMPTAGPFTPVLAR